MANIFKILGFVALGVCGASLLSGILALALPYWQTYSDGIYEVHYGLFKYCGGDECVQYKDVEGLPDDKESSLQATQAMVFLGLFAVVGSLVALLLWLFVRKEMKILGLVAGGLAIAGGLFYMIGMAIYADKWNIPSYDYGAGFAFDILGWLTAWASGGIMLFMRFTRTTGSSAS